MGLVVEEGTFATVPIGGNLIPSHDPASTYYDPRETDTEVFFQTHIPGSNSVLDDKTVKRSERHTAVFPCDNKGTINQPTLRDGSALLQVSIGMTQEDQWAFIKGDGKMCMPKNTGSSMVLRNRLVTALTESDKGYQITTTMGDVKLSTRWSNNNLYFCHMNDPSFAEMTFKLPGNILNGVTQPFKMNKNHVEVVTEDGDPHDAITFVTAWPLDKKNKSAQHHFEYYIRQSEESTQELGKEPDNFVCVSEKDWLEEDRPEEDWAEEEWTEQEE